MNTLIERLRHFLQRRFVRDTMVLQSGQFILILMAVLTGFFTLRILGPTKYGQYGLALAMFNIMKSFNLSGAARIALVDISKALGAGDDDSVNDGLAYFIRMSFSFYFPIVTVFLLIATLWSQTAYESTQIGQWARLLALTVFFEIPYGLVMNVYQSKRDMKALVRYESSRQIIASLARIGALLLGWGIAGLIFVQTTIAVAYGLTSIVVYIQITRKDQRFEPWSHILRRIPSVAVKQRLRLGLQIALEKNVRTFAAQLPVTFLGMVDQTAVGYYQAAMKVITLPSPLVSGIARNLETYLPFRDGESKASLRDAFMRTTFFTGLVWSGFTIIWGVVAPVVLLIYAGTEYISAIVLLYPLLLFALAQGWGVGVGSTFRTLDRMPIIIVIQAVCLTLFGLIGYGLIQTLEAVGAAWYVGIYAFIQTAIYIIVLIRLLKHYEENELVAKQSPPTSPI